MKGMIVSMKEASRDSIPHCSRKTQMQKRKVRKRIKVIRIAFIILLCIISFGMGRALSAIAQDFGILPNNTFYDIINEHEDNGKKTDTKIEEYENEKTDESSSHENNKDEPIEASSSLDNSEINDWKLALVNPWNKIPENYTSSLTYLKNGHAIDKRAYPDLQEMMDACRAEGLSPIICSSYRSMEKQQSLFNKQINKQISRGFSKEEAKVEAAKWVAIPGTSEHQLGLAVDIVALSNQRLDESQEKTEEQQWLMKNCYKYGFILRYPSDKSDITGISYEPWHYRYVGKEAAGEIMKQGITLEEYLEGLNGEDND